LWIPKQLLRLLPVLNHLNIRLLFYRPYEYIYALKSTTFTAEYGVSLLVLLQVMAMDQEDMITDWTEVAESFDAMGLKENLLRGIYAYGKKDDVQTTV